MSSHSILHRGKPPPADKENGRPREGPAVLEAAAALPALGGAEHTPGAVRQLSRAMRGDTEPFGSTDF